MKVCLQNRSNLRFFLLFSTTNMPDGLLHLDMFKSMAGRLKKNVFSSLMKKMIYVIE